MSSQAIRKIYQFNYLSGLLIWQIKLIVACSFFIQNLGFSASSHAFNTKDNKTKSSNDPMKMDMDEISSVVEPIVHPLVSSERALSLLKRVELLTDNWEKGWWMTVFCVRLVLNATRLKLHKTLVCVIIF